MEKIWTPLFLIKISKTQPFNSPPLPSPLYFPSFLKLGFPLWKCLHPRNNNSYEVAESREFLRWYFCLSSPWNILLNITSLWNLISLSQVVKLTDLNFKEDIHKFLNANIPKLFIHGTMKNMIACGNTKWYKKILFSIYHCNILTKL